MGFRYRTGDRVYGGSMEPRLNPDCVDPRLGAKLRPTWPSPLVRQTSSGGSVPERDAARRKSVTGLNPAKKDY